MSDYMIQVSWIMFGYISGSLGQQFWPVNNPVASILATAITWSLFYFLHG